MLRNQRIFGLFQSIRSKMCHMNQRKLSLKKNSQNFDHYVIMNLLRNYIKP